MPVRSRRSAPTRGAMDSAGRAGSSEPWRRHCAHVRASTTTDCHTLRHIEQPCVPPSKTSLSGPMDSRPSPSWAAPGCRDEVPGLLQPAGGGHRQHHRRHQELPSPRRLMVQRDQVRGHGGIDHAGDAGGGQGPVVRPGG